MGDLHPLEKNDEYSVSQLILTGADLEAVIFSSL
jgi:hypothetical protein